MSKKEEVKFAGWAWEHKLEDLQDQLAQSHRLIAAYSHYCHDLTYYIKTLENAIVDVCHSAGATPEVLEKARKAVCKHPVPRPFEVKESEEGGAL